jgi:hypothetical protein
MKTLLVTILIIKIIGVILNLFSIGQGKELTVTPAVLCFTVLINSGFILWILFALFG